MTIQNEDSRINEEKFKSLDKRIEDLKFLVDKIITVLSLGTLVIGIFLSINLNNEKKELARFKTEMENDINLTLGKSQEEANLKLFTPNQEPLENEIIEAIIVKDENEDSYISIYFIIKNLGKSASGEYTTKVYTNEKIELYHRNTKDPKSQFKYETYIDSEGNTIRSFPSQLSHEIYSDIYIENTNNINIGEIYPIRIEIYYSDKVSSTNFKVKIVEQYTKDRNS